MKDGGAARYELNSGSQRHGDSAHGLTLIYGRRLGWSLLPEVQSELSILFNDVTVHNYLYVSAVVNLCVHLASMDGSHSEMLHKSFTES